jgi:hypothetical protein
VKSLIKSSNTTQEGRRINKRFFSFLVCVVVAAFFWLMMSLSKEYEITISFPVRYIHFPKDQVLSTRLPENIDLDIKANGFQLLLYQLKKQQKTIVLDMNDVQALSIKNHFFLLSNNRLNKLENQFSNEVSILKVSPDTIFLNYNKKTIKRVPIKINLTVACEPPYQLTDSIRISPATIDIAGAADVLEKITFVETAPMSLKKVNSSVAVNLYVLRTNALKQVELPISKVVANVSVTKFTEASLELPIEVLNLPRGYNLKTFPDKVTVKYNVAFADYSKINAVQFKAIVDYKKMELGSNKLKVQLIQSPTTIRAAKLSDEKVEYIIRK